MAKWETILEAFDISYLPRTTVKGQVLAGLVAEFTEELDQAGPEEVEMPKKGLRINLVSTQKTWQLFVDGVVN